MADALDALPVLYRAWSSAMLAGPVEPERRADCTHCPMVVAEPPAQSFAADTKCCTYHPELANFHVGTFFRERRPDLEVGRTLLEAKLQAREGVTPLGIDRAPEYPRTLGQRFGQSRALRCPYYVEGGKLTCGVWAAREATCATWFCKHERGRHGRVFWEALRLFLQAVDRALARWCLLELKVPPKQLAAIDAERWLSGEQTPMTPERYAAMWGEHRFGEHRFFAACHELVEPLTWPEVRALGGADVEFRASLARHAHARLGQDPEGVLLAAPTTLVQVQKDEYVLQTYSPYDLQAIPKPLVAVLELFDGRPTPEVVTAAAEQGVTLDPPTLRRMVEVGLLSEHS